jgi:hypothetical protein
MLATKSEGPAVANLDDSCPSVEKGTGAEFMALDELHARRLAAVVSLVEDAVERIEMTLRALESPDSKQSGSASLSPAQIHQMRREMDFVRKRLAEITARFAVRRQKPEPRQMIAAELSSLWVILENALPERMKGYGKEFAPEDRGDWDRHIQSLIRDTDRMRRALLKRKGQS